MTIIMTVILMFLTLVCSAIVAVIPVSPMQAPDKGQGKSSDDNQLFHIELQRKSTEKLPRVRCGSEHCSQSLRYTRPRAQKKSPSPYRLC